MLKYLSLRRWKDFIRDRLNVFPLRMLPWRSGRNTGYLDTVGYSEADARRYGETYGVTFDVIDTTLNKQARDFGARVKYPEILNLIEPGARVLDLGCGPGVVMRDLIEHRGASVVGLDMSEMSIEVCRQMGLEAYQCDLNNFDDEKLKWAAREDWDYVLGLGGVLQNFDYPFMIIKIFSRSIGIYHVLNIGHYFYRLRFLLGRFPYSPTTDLFISGHLPYASLNVTKRYWTLFDFESICESKGLHAEFVSCSAYFGAKLPPISVQSYH